MLLVLVRNLSDLFVLVLVRSFSYIPLASFINELYTPDTTFSEDRVSFTLLMLVSVRISTPDASFMRRYSYTPHIGLVRSFSYTPHASFSQEFLVHS